MIRVTVDRFGKRELAKEFDDIQEAAKWLIEDSYMTNPDVRKIVWENLAECDHIWNARNGKGDTGIGMYCGFCGKDMWFSHPEITTFAEAQ